ncbi:MAG: S-layer homology domain-containing protein [Eubacteriales bacterium]
MNTKVKAAVVFCIAFCLLLSLISTASALPGAVPGDIKGHWAEGTISEWLDKGMVSGFPDGSFRPDQPVTRAEFITMVNKAFEFTGTAEVTFSDVSSTDWFYNEVAKAIKEGYITGYEDGTFKPNNPISRQEAAAILCRVLKIKPEVKPAILSLFVDSESISEWAKASVSAAVENHIMAGYQDFTFRPGNAVTRAEALFAINNAMKTEPIAVKQEPAVAAPAGGGGGHGGGGGGGDTTPPAINSATITVGGVSRAVTISADKKTGSIDFSGTGLNLLGTAMVTKGSIDVSEKAVLKLVVPTSHWLLRPNLYIQQDLNSGANELDVINYLKLQFGSNTGVSLAKLKEEFGSPVILKGTLTDNSNNVLDITLTVTLP